MVGTGGCNISPEVAQRVSPLVLYVTMGGGGKSLINKNDLSIWQNEYMIDPSMIVYDIIS